MDRREFWRVMSAALAMASLTACTKQPPEKIVPYVNQPPEIVQGKPLYFATAMTSPGHSLGLIVKSHMGHPIKVEGNPRHPASFGGTDPFAQTSLMDLYDPDRSQAIVYQSRISDWIAFLGALAVTLEAQQASHGAGLRLLTGTVMSPTLGAQIQTLLGRFPEAKWYQWEAVSRDAVRQGSEMAFGRAMNTIYHFDKADRILVVDGDFLFCGPGNVRYARDFATRRGTRAPDAMNRLYVVESGFTNTGASADHRLPLKQSEMAPFLRAIAQAVGAPGGAQSNGSYSKWVNVIAKDLLAHRGGSLIAVGDQQPAVLHALAHGINAALGNAGNTLTYTNPIEIQPADNLSGLRELVGEMNAGKVDAIAMIGVNPVYDAPADFDFAAALQKVKFKLHCGRYDDETAVYCDWHIPQTHFLEEWSDCVAFDGTASVVQPLIAPIYQGRSAHEILAAFLGQAGVDPRDIVRAYWRSPSPGSESPARRIRVRNSSNFGGIRFWKVSSQTRPAPHRNRRCAAIWHLFWRRRQWH